jgi:hypothetical protein
MVHTCRLEMYRFPAHLHLGNILSYNIIVLHFYHKCGPRLEFRLQIMFDVWNYSVSILSARNYLRSSAVGNLVQVSWLFPFIRMSSSPLIYWGNALLGFLLVVGHFSICWREGTVTAEIEERREIEESQPFQEQSSSV